MATAACEEHGEYVLKLRIQEGEDGTYVLTRTLRTMDDDARAQMEKIRQPPQKAPAQAGQGRRRGPCGRGISLSAPWTVPPYEWAVLLEEWDSAPAVQQEPSLSKNPGVRGRSPEA